MNDLKEVLELYCGKRIIDELTNNKDSLLFIGGEKRNLTLNYGLLIIEENNYDLFELMKILNSIFNIYYKYTIESNQGDILDFEFNSILLYFDNPNIAFENIIKIEQEIKKIIDNSKYKIKSINSLHNSNYLIANWGASKRFKKIILGKNVDFCKSVINIGIEKGKSILLSQSTIDLLNTNKEKFEYLTELNVIGYFNEKIYSWSL